MAVSGPINASAVLNPEKDVGSHLVEGWVGPTAGIGAPENDQEKNLLLLPDFETRDRPFCSQVTILTELPRHPLVYCTVIYVHLKFFIVSKENAE